MLVPLGADGYLVFVGCDLYLTGGGTTVRIVLHFSIFYFFSLALLWGGQRYPPVLLWNVMDCYDLNVKILIFLKKYYKVHSVEDLSQDPCQQKEF
jgi:hypothetical protein